LCLKAIPAARVLTAGSPPAKQLSTEKRQKRMSRKAKTDTKRTVEIIIQGFSIFSQCWGRASGVEQNAIGAGLHLAEGLCKRYGSLAGASSPRWSFETYDGISNGVLACRKAGELQILFVEEPLTSFGRLWAVGATIPKRSFSPSEIDCMARELVAAQRTRKQAPLIPEDIVEAFVPFSAMRTKP
jgi:hypothetical protein